jgi:hypothetical protein
MSFNIGAKSSRWARTPLEVKQPIEGGVIMKKLPGNICGLCLLGLVSTVHAEGLPGMRGADHLGITVPDLKQAVDILVDVMGCKAFYKLGPFKADNDWMEVHLNVNPRAEIPTIQVVRCGNGANLEVFQWSSPEVNAAKPSPSWSVADLASVSPECTREAIAVIYASLPVVDSSRVHASSPRRFFHSA